jgi:hypothetical protein
MSAHNRDDRLEFRRERTMVDTYSVISIVLDVTCQSLPS